MDTNLIKGEIDIMLDKVQEMIRLTRSNSTINNVLLLDIINFVEKVLLDRSDINITNRDSLKNNNVFVLLVEAMENDDNNLFADVLEYELIPLIEAMKN